MPQGVDINLNEIAKKAQEILAGDIIGEIKTKEEPVAFGLKCLYIMAMFDTDKEYDEFAQELEKIDGVQSAIVYKIDLALGWHCGQ